MRRNTSLHLKILLPIDNLPHQQGRLKFDVQTAFSSFQYNKIVFIPNKAFFPVFRRPC